jgi:hypothetical protein
MVHSAGRRRLKEHQNKKRHVVNSELERRASRERQESKESKRRRTDLLTQSSAERCSIFAALLFVVDFANVDGSEEKGNSMKGFKSGAARKVNPRKQKHTHDTKIQHDMTSRLLCYVQPLP